MNEKLINLHCCTLYLFLGLAFYYFLFMNEITGSLSVFVIRKLYLFPERYEICWIGYEILHSLRQEDACCES